MLALWPLDIPLIDHPYVTAASLNLAILRNESSWIAFVRTPQFGRLNCPMPIGYSWEFDVTDGVEDCLRKNAFTGSIDPSQVTVTGLGIYSPSLAPYRPEFAGDTVNLHWNPSGDERIFASHVRARKSQTLTTWSPHEALRSTDLINASIESGDSASLLIGDGSLASQLPLYRFASALSVGRTIGDSYDRRAGVRLHAETSVPGRQNIRSISLWRPRAEWTLRTGDERISRRIGLDDIWSATIPVRPGKVSSAGVPLASVLVAGAAARPENPVGLCNNGTSASNVYSCRFSDGGILVLNHAYHWSWFAMQGGRFLPHLKADGWRNAWTSSSAGNVVIFNALDFIAIALALIGAIVYAFLLLRTQRTTPQ
jgi:hypothetical protein